MITRMELSYTNKWLKKLLFNFEYTLLFLFDNTISHSIYTKNAFQIKNINKCSRGKQPIFYNGQFEKEGPRVAQPMNFLNNKNKLIPKGIQQILEEKSL